MDSAVEVVCICERLMGEMMGFEIMPDEFDVVELRGIFGEPLDGEPMFSGVESGQGCLTGVDRPVVLDEDDRRYLA